MKQYISLFQKHKYSIENFITNIIQNDQISQESDEAVYDVYKYIDSLQAVYIVNDEYVQISPYYYKNRVDNSRIGAKKEHYFSNIRFNEKDIFITNPYLHHRTGRSSITVVKLVKNVFVVYDIDLLKLLEELKLIQHNSKFDIFNRFVYSLGGYSLSLISIFLILYGGYIFLNIFLMNSNDTLIHDMFKSIIAITLGIAIYDLAKTIIAHEVIFKDIEDDKGGQYHMLGKFLISIIIALSIESLMVVFKIALDDYTSLGYAFLLILGVTLMIYGLGKFHHLTKDKCES